MFGEMVDVGLYKVMYWPLQTLSYTFLMENGRSGTFYLHLVANLLRKGGLEYGLAFCRLHGVHRLSLCTPGLPEIQRNLPVVVIVNIVENDFGFDRVYRIMIGSCDPESHLLQHSGCP
jgi:hypothetical protein